VGSQLLSNQRPFRAIQIVVVSIVVPNGGGFLVGSSGLPKRLKTHFESFDPLILDFPKSQFIDWLL